MFLHFEFIEFGPKKTKTLFLILELGPFILAGCYNTGRNVSHADSRTGLVDMLTTGTAGAIVVYPHIIHVKVYLHVIIDFRHHIHSGKRGMTSFSRIKRRNTHQAMHSFF